jgi:hypothetical protein
MRIKNYSEFSKINEYYLDWSDYGDNSSMSKPKDVKFINYKLIEAEVDWSVAIFRNIHTNLYYCFIVESIDEDEFYEYAELPLISDYNEDGGVDTYQDTESFEMDKDIVESYVNDNINHLEYGEGIEDYELGEANFILIDEPLREFLKKEFELESI